MSEQEKQATTVDDIDEMAPPDEEQASSSSSEDDDEDAAARRKFAIALATFCKTLRERFIYVRDIDRLLDTKTRTMITQTAFNGGYLHLMPAGKKGRPAPAKVFLANAKTTKVHSPTYWPGQPTVVVEDGARKVNLWCPHSITPKDGDVSPFLDHIAYIFDGDPQAIQHVLDYLACCVQKPGVKQRSTILVIGKQGIGKDAIGCAMTEILGPQNVRAIGNKELTSSFNGWLGRSQFIIVPELMCGDRLEMMNNLKPLITNDQIEINEKNQPTYWLRNRANFVMFSNHDDAAMLEDGDRRYFVFKSHAEPKDEAYYEWYFRWLENDGAAALAHFFLKRDLSKYNPNKPAPKTIAKEEIVRDSRTAHDAYLFDLFETEQIPFDRDVVVASEIVEYANDRARLRATTKSVAKFLRSVGGLELGMKRIADPRGEPTKRRVWAIHNQDFYKTATESAISKGTVRMNANATEKAVAAPVVDLDIAKSFEEIAQTLMQSMPKNPDRDIAMRALMEAKEVVIALKGAKKAA